MHDDSKANQKEEKQAPLEKKKENKGRRMRIKSRNGLHD